MLACNHFMSYKNNAIYNIIYSITTNNINIIINININNITINNIL